MTYAEYCKSKCEWCAKGARITGISGSHRVLTADDSPTGWSHHWHPCTAPSRDQFEQELQERIKELEQKRFQVAGEIIESVRGSLRGYPNCGGDKGIMQEVGRIVDEKTAGLERENAELRKALEDAPHGSVCASRDEKYCLVCGGDGDTETEACVGGCVDGVVSMNLPCSCWKSRALNPQTTEEK